VYKNDRKEFENKKVENLMIPLSEVIVMNENKEANDALIQLFRKGMSRIFIVDNDSRLLGLVSKTDIINLAKERDEFIQTIKK
jgi:predicted transcriptional regulator